ncbi:FxLYD domain-containing protein [Geobacter sp.]|uniref:FxLYD domain-containing protein n=1 Tax=Geobacter sp. TaxID=46610 RepID=UPI0026206494|nr:FxLYD domain-containing protein [Geobacter sp.]
MRPCTLIAVLIAATLAGCTLPATVPPVQHYPNRVSYYDLTVSWKVTRSAGKVAIEGAVANTSYYYIRDLELTATLLDAGGKEVGEKTSFIIPSQLAIDETAPFSMTIPVTPGAVAERIRFFYRYRLAGEGPSGFPRFQDFEVPIDGRTYLLR